MTMDTTPVQPGINSRRQIVKTGAIAAGAIAAGGAVASLLGATPAVHAAAMGGDLDILNYALTLEHIEDAMYAALLGSGLLYGKALKYAQIFGAQEHAHVVQITAVIKQLGGTPVSAMARYNFPTLTNVKEIINLLVTVEDLGASAYLGAAPLIQNPQLLEAAVSIHSIEAQHATAWRSLAGLDIVPFAFAPATSMDRVVAAVKPFLTM